MRTDTVVDAVVRETRGKNEARRTRVSGKIPGVVYGAQKDPVSIAVDPKFIQSILRSKTGHNTIFNLQVTGGESSPVMVVDEQYDPVKSTLLHVDLKRIDLAKRLRVAVPVLVVGEAKGIKLQGGLLEIINRSVEIEVLPDEIPQSFTVDVTELAVGQSVRSSDIQMPGSALLVSAGEAVIAHVVGQRAEAAPAAAAVAEPEVAKAKGKKEEAAPAGDKGKAPAGGKAPAAAAKAPPAAKKK